LVHFHINVERLDVKTHGVSGSLKYLLSVAAGGEIKFSVVSPLLVISINGSNYNIFTVKSFNFIGKRFRDLMMMDMVADI